MAVPSHVLAMLQADFISYKVNICTLFIRIPKVLLPIQIIFTKYLPQKLKIKSMQTSSLSFLYNKVPKEIGLMLPDKK